MIDDVRPPVTPERSKPKRIEPLPKPATAPLHEQAREVDPSFKTPEETAAAQPDSTEPTIAQHDVPKTNRFKLSWPPSRKQAIIGGIIALVILGGGGTAWALTHHKTVATVTPKKAIAKQVIKPAIIYSTLSGLPVPDNSVNQRTVTAVMIENSLDARPQSGLGDAGVVFEAVAEGGVTRFLALFQDTAPANIGPVRSARPYYVSWELGFDAAYAHVGGSPDALSDITAWGVHDMNQFYNSGSYHRTTDRDSPHNVYTSIDTLNQLESSKGFTSSFTGFTRKADQPYTAPPAAAATTTTSKTKPTTPADTRTAANSLDFALSGPAYNSHYDYIAASNSYNRSEAGVPHIDANGNKQISPKVVIAMVVPLARGALDASGAYYSDYNVIGSGQAYIFQDGTVSLGQWNKASNTAQVTFTDAAGTPLPLNRGQTWISAVSASSQVTYK